MPPHICEITELHSPIEVLVVPGKYIYSQWFKTISRSFENKYWYTLKLKKN